MNIKKLIGTVLIIYGFVMMGPLESPSGFVIGITDISLFSFSGLLSLIAGFILMVSVQDRMEPKKVIDEIVKQFENDEIDAIEAVDRMDDAINIQKVVYKPGVRHTISGTENSFPIKLRKGNKAEELAIVEFIVSVYNNPKGRRYNELHLGKGLSTKHYSSGFEKKLEDYKLNHRSELETVLGIS